MCAAEIEEELSGGDAVQSLLAATAAIRRWDGAAAAALATPAATAAGTVPIAIHVRAAAAAAAAAGLGVRGQHPVPEPRAAAPPARHGVGGSAARRGGAQRGDQPEPEPEPEGGYVDFGQNGTGPDYEPLLRTMSPPGGAGNYLGARRDVPLLPTISKLRDQMAVTVGAEMGAGAEAGADEGGADTYEAKRNAIMRSMSVAPPDPAGEPEDAVTWEWKDLVQVAKYNTKGARVGSQQQYLVVDGEKEGGARLLFYRSLEDRLAERAPVRSLEAADISMVIVSGVRVTDSKGSVRLRTAPRWLSALTAARKAAMLQDSQELFQELCDYVKWRAANPVNHELVSYSFWPLCARRTPG
eukprot:COSAG02_NODE_6396_length_3600_cov_1.826050_2_plen_355_part_00